MKAYALVSKKIKLNKAQLCSADLQIFVIFIIYYTIKAQVYSLLVSHQTRVN